jgi:hypothetical protein
MKRQAGEADYIGNGLSDNVADEFQPLPISVGGNLPRLRANDQMAARLGLIDAQADLP